MRTELPCVTIYTAPVTESADLLTDPPPPGYLGLPPLYFAVRRLALDVQAGRPVPPAALRLVEEVGRFLGGGEYREAARLAADRAAYRDHADCYCRLGADALVVVRALLPDVWARLTAAARPTAPHLDRDADWDGLERDWRTVSAQAAAAAYRGLAAARDDRADAGRSHGGSGQQPYWLDGDRWLVLTPGRREKVGPEQHQLLRAMAGVDEQLLEDVVADLNTSEADYYPLQRRLNQKLRRCGAAFHFAVVKGYVRRCAGAYEAGQGRGGRRH